ncbi:MAG: nucleotidyltransferase family protein [Bacteroidota bacterium]|nr:nucleotidyltransferase family protein [Bacteroidota bacterium]
MHSTISAIILSAGSSRRMGTPKALLKIGKKIFLHHIIDTVESVGLTNNVVVLGFESQTIREILSSFSGTIIVNEAWEEGQLSSIIACINALNTIDCEGILICPVDHPMITTALIKKLVESFQHSRKKIIIPTYHGRRGHPIIISSELFVEIKNASFTVGLREVVHAHENDIELVSTDEEGILINIDTPEDYRKYVGNLQLE